MSRIFHFFSSLIFTLTQIVILIPAADRLVRSAPWGIGGEATKFLSGVDIQPHACKAHKNKSTSKETNTKLQKSQTTTN